MMKKRTFHILYIFLVLLLPFICRAQQPLNLKQAIDIALKNSLSIEIGKNYVQIAGINNNYGIAGGLPFVSGSVSDVEQTVSLDQKYANPANNKTSSNVGSNNFAASITGSVLITNGERVVTAKKRFGRIEMQTKDQLNSRIQSIVVNVMLRYYDIIRQESYAKTLQKAIDVSKQKLDIVKTQQSVGMANNADLFQAEVDLNTQTQLLQAQQLVIDQDKTDLLYQLTLNPDSTLNIADTAINIDGSIKLEDVLNSIPSHPDITAAQDQVLINQYIEKEITAQRYPSLSANTGYNYTRNQSAAGFSLLNLQQGPFVGISLGIPIFNGGIYKRQQQIAGMNITNAELQKDTLINSYTANTIKNWQAYTSNIQQLQQARQNYELSQKLVDLVLQRFQLRQATIVDVITAEQSFENAANLLINISYAAKAAEIQLRRYENKVRY